MIEEEEIKNQKDSVIDSEKAKPSERRFSQIGNKYSSDSHSKNSPEMNKSLVLIELQRDDRLFQKEKILYIIMAYILMIIITFVRGSEYNKSILEFEK